MAIRPEFRWWLLTIAVVAALLGISALALDRPDVAWRQGHPVCPHCRSAVPTFAVRCAQCREQFDWATAPDAESPLSPWSLSALEVEWVRERVEGLGAEEAGARVARTLGVEPAAAARYLGALGQGRCGWCGGTGVDLPPSGARPEKKEPPCPVCLGRSLCIACGGDRRIRVGDAGARSALRAYARELLDLAPAAALETQRAAARQLAQTFLERHAGTVEATWLAFWPTWEVGQSPWLATPDDVADDVERATKAREPGSVKRRAVEAARERLDRVLLALGSE